MFSIARLPSQAFGRRKKIAVGANSSRAAQNSSRRRNIYIYIYIYMCAGLSLWLSLIYIYFFFIWLSQDSLYNFYRALILIEYDIYTNTCISIWKSVYVYMSAPINTQHRKWNYLIAVALVATCVSTAFSYTNGASAFGRRRKNAAGRRPAAFFSVGRRPMLRLYMKKN